MVPAQKYSETEFSTSNSGFDEEMQERNKVSENNHVGKLVDVGTCLANNVVIDEDGKSANIITLIDEIQLLRKKVQDVEKLQKGERRSKLVKKRHTEFSFQQLSMDSRFTEYACG